MADAYDGFPDQAVYTQALIAPEQGRWVVYIETMFWETDARKWVKGDPIETVRQRIADYATEQQAQTAAHWMQRGASRRIDK